MTFENPKILWLLLVAVPLLGAFLWRSWRRKQYLIGQFVQSRLLAHLTVGVSKRLQKTRLWLVLAAVALVLFSLAQPRWGFVWEEARQQGLDILIAIDTSRSMLAQDLSPNRLTRAKLAALDLMKLARNDRLGLIAFAGTAFLQCPLTLDEEAFRQSVNVLDVEIIPQGGTVLTEAIDTAAKSFSNDADNHKVLVLFTDGEDHEEGAIAAAKRASEHGVRIFTLGVGTPNGDVLRQRDESGAESYVKDAGGNVVKSRLNESLLTQIATSASGFYLPLSDPRTMEVLYERGLAPLPKSELASRMVKRFREQFQWFLGLAIVLLLLEMFLPDRKRIVPSPAIHPATNPEMKKAVGVTALVLCCSMAAVASSRSAHRNYEAGRFKQADQEYQKLLEKKPGDPRLLYNAGAAAYQAEEYERAARHFATALTSPDLDLQQLSYYNLGNSLYRVGEQQQDPNQKSASWESAVQQFQSALKLNPNDADSKFNLELVQKKLQELKQQQQQKPQPSDSDKNQDDPKDDKGGDQSKAQEKQQGDQQENQSQQDQSQSDSESSQEKSPPSQDQNSGEKKEQESKAGQSEQQEKDSNRDQPQKQSGQSGDSSKDEGEKAEAMNSAVPAGQMTPEQVKRLLDAQKGEEKAMIFLPQNARRKQRVFKDW